MKRRWTLRLRQPDGTYSWVTVEVRDGVIHTLRAPRLDLTPRTISKLIEVYRQAQAVAMLDRGEW